jgi:hypothetical protein
MWVKAPDHVESVASASYDDVPTTRLPLAPIEREILGPHHPTGWVLQRMDGQRGPDRGVVRHEAPQGAPVLTANQALDAADKGDRPAGC